MIPGESLFSSWLSAGADDVVLNWSVSLMPNSMIDDQFQSANVILLDSENRVLKEVCLSWPILSIDPSNIISESVLERLSVIDSC